MMIGSKILTTGGTAPRLLRAGIAPLAVVSSHGLRMLLSLVIIKAIAIHLGATGLGQLGNFMSIISAMAVLAGGGIANGVTKYVAEFSDDAVRLNQFLRAASLYGLAFALLVATICGMFAWPLAELVFGDPSYWWVVLVVGLLQFVGSLGVIAAGVANGLRRIDLLAGMTIPTYLAIMPMAYGLVSYFGIAGAALSLALSITATGLPGLLILHRLHVFADIIRAKSVGTDFLNLARFSLMLLASAAFFPIAETLLRSHISAVLGLESAGLWQALTRLSAAYLGFFNVYLAARYMPLLSRSKGAGISKIVRDQLFASVASFLAVCTAIYLFRDAVVQALFSDAFLPLSDVLAYQLTGDCFRLASYVVGFLLVAKGKTRLYILAEFVQMTLWVIFGYIAIAIQPDLGFISQSYALAYLLYFFFVCAMTYLSRKQLQ